MSVNRKDFEDIKNSMGKRSAKEFVKASGVSERKPGELMHNYVKRMGFSKEAIRESREPKGFRNHEKKEAIAKKMKRERTYMGRPLRELDKEQGLGEFKNRYK